MTDQEAIKRYINAFGGQLPELTTDYWDKLTNGTQWFNRVFPNSPYTELAERYLRACLEIITIEHEINVRGGIDIDG